MRQRPIAQLALQRPRDVRQPAGLRSDVTQAATPEPPSPQHDEVVLIAER